MFELQTEEISSAYLTLRVALNVGPRLVGLRLAGSDENLLGETPRLNWETVHGPYRTFGGHRLWAGPQIDGRTDVPDDQPVTVEHLENGVRLTQVMETPTGIRKAVEVHLYPQRAGLRIIHRLVNCGIRPVELAPWAITMVPLGGTASIPLPARAMGPDTHIPNRSLIFWPYTRLEDPRLHLETDCVMLEGQAALPACKVGSFSTGGLLEYCRNGVILRKQITVQPDQVYTDLGCNLELFVNDQVLELETFGPLVRLDPGDTVEHVEEWEIERVAR